MEGRISRYGRILPPPQPRGQKGFHNGDISTRLIT